MGQERLDACTQMMMMLCAQSLSMLWVCGMEQGWAIQQVEHVPAEACAQSERLLRRVRAATESHTRWELLRL